MSIRGGLFRLKKLITIEAEAINANMDLIVDLADLLIIILIRASMFSSFVLYKVVVEVVFRDPQDADEVWKLGLWLRISQKLSQILQTTKIPGTNRELTQHEISQKLLGKYGILTCIRVSVRMANFTCPFLWFLRFVICVEWKFFEFSWKLHGNWRYSTIIMCLMGAVDSS